MTTEVYLVRHGETLFNRLGKVQGWCDTPLTNQGISDLKKTAEALADVHFDNMYSSDLKRAIDTVHLIKDGNRVSQIGKIKKFPEFREVFYGSFEGSEIDHIWKATSRTAGIRETSDVTEIINTIGIYKFREVVKKADPRHLAENTEELNLRMARAIDRLKAATQREKRVLLVSHGDFIKTLGIKYWEQSDGLHDIPFPTNGSVTRGVLTDSGKFEIVDYNCPPEEFEA